MDRRLFLTTLASGILVAGAAAVAANELGKAGLSPFSVLSDGRIGSGSPNIPSPRPTPTSSITNETVFSRFAVPRLNRIPVPGGTISSLPGNEGLLALTVDDGASAETVKGYCDFVERTGFRMTFFVTSTYGAWDANKDQLRKLIESGHVQMANHTSTHKALTKVSDGEVVDELTGCESYLRNTFGVSGHPYFRPPFGYIDDRVANIAAGLGYSTPVLWYGTFGDAGRCTPEQIQAMADQWLLPEHIVIGHANFPPVLDCLNYIEAILHQRKLQPITLDDLYVRNA